MRKTPAEKMRELRLRNGLSTRQLAKALGYRGKATSLETIIKRFENGSRKIPEQTKRLVEFMDVYGVPPDWYRGVR